jgi:hypothetical protein
MFKQRLLDIQHRLNAVYGNSDESNIIRRINLLNSSFFEIAAAWERIEPYDEIIESIKIDRENLSPIEFTEIELLDFAINELELLVYSKI